MSFTSENGYIPETIEALISIVREGINTQFGTDYTVDTFIGTNWYKYFYSLIQELQSSEVKTSEIFDKLTQYFEVTNERLFRPGSTPEGIVDRILEVGYTASVRPMIVEDAGKIAVCVDIDDEIEDYEAQRLAINTVLKTCVAAGIYFEGTEEDTIALSNGQGFDFSFNLPDRVETLLKLTITLSENNTFAVSSPEDVKALLFANVQARYHLGLNLEPQKYFAITDAPWAAEIKLEYSIDDGMNWLTDVIEAEYDAIYEMTLENIEVVEE